MLQISRWSVGIVVAILLAAAWFLIPNFFPK
jgi:hypothetical protein